MGIFDEMVHVLKNMNLECVYLDLIGSANLLVFTFSA